MKNSGICESLKLTLVIRRVFLIGFEIVLIGKNNLWLSKLHWTAPGALFFICKNVSELFLVQFFQLQFSNCPFVCYKPQPYHCFWGDR